MKTALVTYRDRNFIDRFRCLDHPRRVRISRPWWSGSLLYGYVDRFNVVTIAKEDILQIEED